jgi:acyl transferase domain-containing protein
MVAMPLAADSAEELESATDAAAELLRENPAGRPPLGGLHRRFRRFCLASDAVTAANALTRRDPELVVTGAIGDSPSDPAFLLAGAGDILTGRAPGLYRRGGVFREETDRLAELLMREFGLDPRPELTAAPPTDGDGSGPPGGAIPDLRMSHAGLFVLQYALARSWIAAGIRPAALLGHSLGEYVAACLAGVFSEEDALRLVMRRCDLVSALPAGAMLAVRLPEREAARIVGDRLAVAAVNAPSSCVVSGPLDAVAEFERAAGESGLSCRYLPMTHAFHSPMMEPVRVGLTSTARRMRLRPPKIPMLCGATGTWTRPAELTDPAYWARHMCSPVRFADCLRALLRMPSVVLIEMGPANTLTTLAEQAIQPDGRRPAIASLRSSSSWAGDVMNWLGALGRAWVAGLAPAWEVIPMPALGVTPGRLR